MAMPSATDAAARWAQNFGASGTKWAAGVQAVTVAPGQLAARQADLWANNTMAAKPRFAANSAKVSREEWISVTVAKGQGRLASGAQAAQSKVEAVFGRLFPYIGQVVNGLPPRGDLEANITRSAQFARGMAKFRTGG
jgi:hypothetical protein